MSTVHPKVMGSVPIRHIPRLGFHPGSGCVREATDGCLSLTSVLLSHSRSLFTLQLSENCMDCSSPLLVGGGGFLGQH